MYRIYVPIAYVLYRIFCVRYTMCTVNVGGTMCVHMTPPHIRVCTCTTCTDVPCIHIQYYTYTCIRRHIYPSTYLPRHAYTFSCIMLRNTRSFYACGYSEDIQFTHIACNSYRTYTTMVIEQVIKSHNTRTREYQIARHTC